MSVQILDSKRRWNAVIAFCSIFTHTVFKDTSDGCGWKSQ